MTDVADIVREVFPGSKDEIDYAYLLSNNIIIVSVRGEDRIYKFEDDYKTLYIYQRDQKLEKKHIVKFKQVLRQAKIIDVLEG